MVRITYKNNFYKLITTFLFQFAAGFLFSLIIIGLIIKFHKGVLDLTITGWFSWFFNLLIGIFLIFILFLILVEKSKFFCLSIFSASIPTIITLNIFQTIINLEALFFGFLVGGLFAIILVYRVKFDILAGICKILAHIFLLVFLLFILIYCIDSGSFLLNQYKIISLITIIVLSIIFWKYVCINLKGITSSHIFIFGDTGSGKSVFLAALNIFLRRHHQSELVIQSIITLYDERKKQLSLDHLSHKLLKGERIQSTNINEIALYQIPCKIWNFIPVNISSIDYAGGWTSVLDKNKFEKYLKEISDAFSKNVEEVRKSLKNAHFLEELSRFNPDQFNINIDKIAQVVIYDRLSSAGKILFLIDGSKLNSEQDNEIYANLETISRIVQEFKTTKQYCFVVTKSDVIEDINEYVEKISQYSKKAQILEDYIYKKLLKSHTFQGIINSIDIHPLLKPLEIKFFLISIDQTNKSNTIVPRYNPWRLSHLVKFILKF